MSEIYRSPYASPEPYIPASLSEIYDFLAPMVGSAPTFVDETGVFDQNIDSEFNALVAGLGKVRGKLGEERYAAAVDLAARAKSLFLEDQNNDNGKTMQGIKLLYEIEAIVQSARRRRSQKRSSDEASHVSED